MYVVGDLTSLMKYGPGQNRFEDELLPKRNYQHQKFVLYDVHQHMSFSDLVFSQFLLISLLLFSLADKSIAFLLLSPGQPRYRRKREACRLIPSGLGVRVCACVSTLPSNAQARSGVERAVF